MFVQLINLDARPDRLERFAARAAEVGLAFERLAGSDGDARRFHEAAARMPPTRIGEVVGPRGLACVDSHRRAWAALLERGEPLGAVFEDDIYLASDLGALIADPSWLPRGAHVARLETMNTRAALEPAAARTATGRTLHRLRSIHMGAAGYVVTRAGAERLLEGTAEPFDTSDRMMFDFRTPLSRGLATYQMLPAACVQADHAGGLAPEWGLSDINAERYPRARVDHHGRPRIGGGARASLAWRRAGKLAGGVWAAARHGGRYRRIPYAPTPPAV